MSSKADLFNELHEIGYDLGPFASKETLLNVLRLHSEVLTTKNLNVAELNDLELRKDLIRRGLIVGPITNHTRSIYQRKLLETLTDEKTEGKEDEGIEEDLIVNENRLYPDLSGKKTFSYGLPKNYVEPMVIRHEYKPTKSTDQNTIRSRIPAKPLIDVTPNKVNDDQSQVVKKNTGTALYAGITIFVALVVFIAYFLFQ